MDTTVLGDSSPALEAHAPHSPKVAHRQTSTKVAPGQVVKETPKQQSKEQSLGGSSPVLEAHVPHSPKVAYRQTSTKVAPGQVPKEAPKEQPREEPKEDPIPLWDQAYDALKKENPSLIGDYEDLLSRALQQSK